MPVTPAASDQAPWGTLISRVTYVRPAITAWTASRSSSPADCLTRKPEAPSPIALTASPSVGVSGQDDELCSRSLGDELPHGVEAVHHRHRNISHDDVGTKPSRALHELAAIAHPSKQFSGFTKQLAHCLPNLDVIVREEDLGPHSSTTRASVQDEGHVSLRALSAKSARQR